MLYVPDEYESIQAVWEVLTQDHLPYIGKLNQGFFPGGDWGGPPIRRKFCQSPPHPTLVPVFGPRLVPPQPRFVPENLKNLNTFLCQI